MTGRMCGCDCDHIGDTTEMVELSKNPGELEKRLKCAVANCDVCGVPLGEDGFDAYRCGGTHICVKNLQERLRQEQESNRNNVACWEMRLAAAEALLREVLEKEEPWNAVPAFEWLAKAKEVCGE